MAKREAGTLAFKILGAYLVVKGLVVIPNMLSWPLCSKFIAEVKMPVSQGLFLLSSLAPDAIMLACGVLLWVYSIKLASAVFPTDEDGVPADQGTVRDWLTTVFMVTGLYFLARGIPGLIGVVVNHYDCIATYDLNFGDLLGWLLGGTWRGGGGFAHHLTSAVLGCVLVLSANKMTSFLYPAGISSADAEEWGMGGRDIAVLGIRLLAIYLVIIMVAYLPSTTATVAMARMEGLKIPSLWIAVYPLGLLVITTIIAVSLWRFAPAISGLIRPTPANGSQTVSLTAGNIRSAALSAVGVLLCVYAVLHLTRIIFVDLTPLPGMETADMLPSTPWVRVKPALIQSTIQLAIGIWLFLRPRAAARASGRLESPVER